MQYRPRITRDLWSLLHTDNRCQLCGFLLTTPVKLCKHYFDLLCYMTADETPKCSDPTCFVAPINAYPYPCAQLKVDLLKVVQIKEIADKEQLDYETWLHKNNEILFDFTLAEATKRLKLDDVVLKYDVCDMMIRPTLP
jgi:hypothetical protein